jgi:hypothetical protein
MAKKAQKTAEEREMEKALAEVRQWARENPEAWKYSLYDDFDRAAMKLPLTEATYTHVVCRLVESLWHRQRWRWDLKTDEHHRKYIEAYRSRYKFPDYLELVGPPQQDHYDENGHLTAQRKATLLLIGVFDWRGLRIAKHQAVFGFNSWRYGSEPRYTHDKKGWYVPIRRRKQSPKNPTVGDYFSPLRNFTCKRLERHLALTEKYTTVVLRDHNHYNCHPDNIEIVKTRGRTMTCKFCGSTVTAATSKRFKWDGGTIRACLQCLMDGTVPESRTKSIL